MKAKKFLLPLLFSCLALGAMGGCADNTENGQFAWLDSAYESGWFTFEDLEAIATRYNAGQTEDAAALDRKIKKDITTAYCKKLNIEEFYGYVKISLYYGTFGDCFIVEIGSDCEHGGGDPIFYDIYEIDGVTFYGYSPVGVYKKTQELH